METRRLETYVIALARALPRRSLLWRMLGGAFGALTLSETAAKKKRKKKLVLNEFGCVAVGGKCRGNDANCCSGVCEGKKPKKGGKDKSVCVAHNVGICTPGRNICEAGPGSLSECGDNAVCTLTTGDAPFCANNEAFSLKCRNCSTDAECVAQGLPPGAACIIFSGGSCGDGCCDENGNSSATACVPPGAL